MQSNTPAAAPCCSPRDSARPGVASRPRAIATIGTGDQVHPDWVITMAGIRSRPHDAWAQAEAALEKEPRSLEALLLWSAPVTTREEIEPALGRLEGVGGDFGGLARHHLTLGSLHLRRQDASRAAGAFREAVAREPRSVEAHVALGHFLLTQNDVAGAERAFKTAAGLAPVGSAGRKSRAFC